MYQHEYMRTILKPKDTLDNAGILRIPFFTAKFCNFTGNSPFLIKFTVFSLEKNQNKIPKIWKSTKVL